MSHKYQTEWKVNFVHLRPYFWGFWVSQLKGTLTVHKKYCYNESCISVMALPNYLHSERVGRWEINITILYNVHVHGVSAILKGFFFKKKRIKKEVVFVGDRK